MVVPRRVSWLAALSLLVILSPHAHAAVEVAGHWEGFIRPPQMEVAIRVDLTKNAQGQLAGTFDNPARSVAAFPLSNVALDGTSVTFEIKASGGGTFRGNVGADGKSIEGTFSMAGPDGQSHELPFELTRKGEAKIDTTPKSAAISGKLEGTWRGTLEVEGQSRQIGLKLSNHADGTATGLVISNEGAEIPITRIAQVESKVTLDVARVGGAYAGTLNADGTELSGTWTQGPFVAPLTFRRVVATSAAR